MGQLTRFFAAIMFLPLLAACEDDDEVLVMVRYELVFDRTVADFADDVTEKGKAAGTMDDVGSTVRDALDLVKTKMLTLKEGEYKVGDRRVVEDEIRLLKSEKGWIYRGRP